MCLADTFYVESYNAASGCLADAGRSSAQLFGVIASMIGTENCHEYD